LLWSLDAGFQALWQPFSRAIGFLITAIAVLGIPESSLIFATADRLNWILTGTFFYWAILHYLAAWMLSHWVYGLPPLRALSHYRKFPVARKHV